MNDPASQNAERGPLEILRQGEPREIGVLLEGFRASLHRMVHLRLDQRLKGRVDTSDVVQEVFLEATERRDQYEGKPAMPFHLWLRFLTAQKMMELARFHLGAQARDVRKERAFACPVADSSRISMDLSASMTSPSQAVHREESRSAVDRALKQMDELDREVLILRHFEQLSNAEVALELGIETSAASKRYIRALTRIKKVLDAGS